MATKKKAVSAAPALDEPLAAASADKLQELRALIAQMQLAEGKVASCEEELKAANERLRVLAQEDIPAFMKELEISSLVLETGETVTVGTEVYCGISKANKGACFDCLENAGHGDLIKAGLELIFGKDQLEEAVKLRDELIARGLEPSFDMSVHASTLKAFVKERLEAGEEFPMELFGAMSVSNTKIKPPKKSKASK